MLQKNIINIGGKRLEVLRETYIPSKADLTARRISKILKDDNPKYVDILVGCYGDEKRFIDIYTIIHRKSKDEAYEFKEKFIKKVKTYFEEVLCAISENNEVRLKHLSKYVHEAKYTGLGFSTKGPGKGFGKDKFNILVASIRNSEAYKSKLINDILDVELYVKNIGVDIISDLVTNLIQDVLGEYTENTLNKLAMADRIRYKKLHYWDELQKEWKVKEVATVAFSEELGGREYNYLLVPLCFTSDENQKQNILGKVFNDCVYDKFKNVILLDEDKYSYYVRNCINGNKHVDKKKVTEFLNIEYSSGIAKVGDGYLTSKGILDLVQRFDDIRMFIERDIKQQ